MYSGKGTFKEFVRDADKALKAVANTVLEFPIGTDSDTSSLRVDGTGEAARLVLDLRDAQVFSLLNVFTDIDISFHLTGLVVETRSGRLIIDLETL